MKNKDNKYWGKEGGGLIMTLMTERGNVIVESNKYHWIDLNVEKVEMLTKNSSKEGLGDQREKEQKS